ncbi:hypothetical protein TNCV_4371741 [Trichonephila clavipes]|nr:hypothetical protein TNCV_4371741 [Trichonephila clavipes]
MPFLEHQIRLERLGKTPIKTLEMLKMVVGEFTMGLHRNVGASRFIEPYGRQGCVLARTVESNQGGRFDGNESIADFFLKWCEESINAALIEEQNVKLNQIANDERTGLSPLQTVTSVISALTNKLEEINLRVKRLQEASSVTARKTGGGLFRRRETVFKCFYCGFEGHRQAECRKKRMDERKVNYQPPGKRREQIFCFPSPKPSFFRPAMMGGRRPLRYSCIFAFALFTGNRDYTGMWVRRGSLNLMAGKVVFLRGLLSPIRVVDLSNESVADSF